MDDEFRNIEIGNDESTESSSGSAAVDEPTSESSLPASKDDEILDSISDLKLEIMNAKLEEQADGESSESYAEVLNDIAALESYQSTQIMVLTCFVLVLLGVTVGAFVFNFFKSR